MPRRDPPARKTKRRKIAGTKTITAFDIAEKTFGGKDFDLLIVDDIEGTVDKEKLTVFMENILGKKVDEASYQLFSKLFKNMKGNLNPFKTFSRKGNPFPNFPDEVPPLSKVKRGGYQNPLPSSMLTPDRIRELYDSQPVLDDTQQILADIPPFPSDVSISSPEEYKITPAPPPRKSRPYDDFMDSSSASLTYSYETTSQPVVEPSIAEKTPTPALPFNKEPKKPLKRSIIL